MSRPVEARLEVYERAVKFYRQCLVEPKGAALWAKTAQAYITKTRAISPEVAKELELGFGQPGRPLPAILDRERIEIAAELGLVYGESVDAMVGRVTFPLRDVYGRIVGVTGRAVAEDEARRYNTTRSTPPNLGRSHMLYGLYQARRDIKIQGHVILVEGPIDMAVAWSAGLRNTVAGLGLALSPKQKELLVRCSDHVTLLLDEPDDTVKQKKMDDLAYRLTKELEEMGMSVKRTRPPKGMDPADFLAKRMRTKR